MKLGAAAQDVADLIEAHGVRATVDGERIELPCAVVGIGSVDFDRLGAGCYSATWNVYLIAADHGPTEAFDDLGDMLANLADLGVEHVEAVTYSAHGREFPGLMFSLTTDVSDDA